MNRLIQAPFSWGLPLTSSPSSISPAKEKAGGACRVESRGLRVFWSGPQRSANTVGLTHAMLGTGVQRRIRHFLPSGNSRSRASFLYLDSLDTGAGSFLREAVSCRVCSGIPGLCLLVASHIPPICDNPRWLQTWPNVPWET